MKRISLSVLVVLMAAPVLAAGGDEENIFAGDLGNMVWTVLIFGAVLFVLGKFAWGPLLNSLQERERFIRESLEKADTDRQSAEERLKEYSDKLDEARAEATGIVEEGRRDADVVRARIEEEARAESEKMIERAKREIEIATQTAVKELYTTSATLATDMASRIVEKDLSAEDHDRLIAESIARLGETETN
ncbi:MAG: F0F1 ATP synthase subunit B [Acidobacteriota bacterium]|nr:F0F1 ATP synthase subunit B [Acidobacteriota bacterium]